MYAAALSNPFSSITASTYTVTPRTIAQISYTSLHRRFDFQFILADRRRIWRTNPPSRKLCRTCTTPPLNVHGEFKAEEVESRRCSPLLESEYLPNGDALSAGEWKTVPDIWRSSAENFGDRVALVDPYHHPPSTLTYKQLEQEILDFSEGLRVAGVKPGEKLALFADNSCRWLVADQGIMTTGAINVVRGSRSSVNELLQIFNHSESIALAVDSPELFNRIAEAFYSGATLRFVVLLWGEKTSLLDKVPEGLPVYLYNEIIELGHESRRNLLDSHDASSCGISALAIKMNQKILLIASVSGQKYTYEAINSDDVATIVYTSGTTGNPKGVMLTHKNMLHQVNNLWDIVPAAPGDRFLSMLPPWHAYERACEYFIFTCGIEQVYTTVKHLKDDLRKYQPNYIISVPLVYETLYSGIQKQISSSPPIRKFVAYLLISVSLAYMDFKRVYEGKYLTKNQKQHPFLIAAVDWLWSRVIAAILFPLHTLAKKLVYEKIHSAIGISKAGISGGGSLPTHVDRFYEAIGIKLQNGYGLTESSPVLAARRPANNVLGSIGPPLQHTEIKVVDSNTGDDLPHGLKGIVKVKGPQVMKGYYKNEMATEKVLGKDGWLDTGDIGWISPSHSIGRSRNCGGLIVLEGREKDTIVLSTGENVEPSEIEESAIRSGLILQIVVIGQDQRRLGAIIVPNKEEILVAVKKESGVEVNASELSKEKINNLLYKELRNWTSQCSFQVGPIIVADEPFTIENGLLTPTMKVRRDKVIALYERQINNMYK